MHEPLRYRAWKRLAQGLSTLRSAGDQHDRLAAFDADVVVIMDACRADTLNAVTPWALDTCRSPASSTTEWLTVAADTGIFADARIVAANSQYHQLDRDLGEAELHGLWETDWEDRFGTVLPEPVLERADSILDEDDSPVVVHLLQPHAPYVAKLGGEWVDILPDTDVWKGDRNSERLSPQVAMAGGHVDTTRAARGYRASVESTWDVIAEYVGQWVTDGNSVVITADHGEGFGRLRDYGFYCHPHKCHVAPLVRVPFITLEPATEPDDPARTAEEKLRALGYKQ
ncbi:hypothetical protein [Halovenus marina]|uniref:hypothetical protein n=1 Tax=Halovenus marina TaxID=3396621 RepID=UPI003F5743BC